MPDFPVCSYEPPFAIFGAAGAIRPMLSMKERIALLNRFSKKSAVTRAAWSKSPEESHCFKKRSILS